MRDRWVTGGHLPSRFWRAEWAKAEPELELVDCTLHTAPARPRALVGSGRLPLSTSTSTMQASTQEKAAEGQTGQQLDNGWALPRHTIKRVRDHPGPTSSQLQPQPQPNNQQLTLTLTPCPSQEPLPSLATTSLVPRCSPPIARAKPEFPPRPPTLTPSSLLSVR